MKCDTMMLNTDGSEAVIDSHKFWGEGAHTQNELSVFAGLAKSYKVEIFKFGISQNLKALKFVEYESEES